MKVRCGLGLLMVLVTVTLATGHTVAQERQTLRSARNPYGTVRQGAPAHSIGRDFQSHAERECASGNSAARATTA